MLFLITYKYKSDSIGGAGIADKFEEANILICCRSYAENKFTEDSTSKKIECSHSNKLFQSRSDGNRLT